MRMRRVSSAPPLKSSSPEEALNRRAAKRREPSPAAPVVPIEAMRVRAFTIPTDAPESDGTLEWHSTTLVLVDVEAAGEHGLGFTYADTATARVIHEHLIPELVGKDA